MGFGSGSDDFNDAGPTHLKHVDWTRPDHVRIVAACLVMGVYVLERARQEKRDTLLAQPWFTSFGFVLHRELFRDKDKSIYGAVYKFVPPPGHLPPEAPEYVIAFRGTVLKKKSFSQDAKSDIHILHQRFHKRKHTKRATDEVESVVFPNKDNPGRPILNVWLVGHSLGSALAIQAGKNLAKKDVLLPTFLFDPPYPSLVTDMVGHEGLKQWIEKKKRKFKEKLVNSVKHRDQIAKEQASFAKLSKWCPHLFVNQNDWICSGYIGYFEQRKELKYINSDEWMLDSMYSTRALFKDAVKNMIKKATKMKATKEDSYYEPFYLFPTAILTINAGLEGDEGKKQSHGIRQWWRKDLPLRHAIYPSDHCKLHDASGE